MPKITKIALVGYKLSHGGAERVLSDLSIYFKKMGLDVHILVMIDQVTYPYAGTLLNLGKLRNASNSIFNKVKRFIAFRNYVKTEKFDAIIDFRFRVHWLQEIFIYTFIYRGIRIQTIHSGRYFSYLFKNKALSKYIFKNFNAIVCVSEGQKNVIKKELHFQNLVTINNAVDIEGIQNKLHTTIDLNYTYIIAAGRFAPSKQLNRLIETYSSSKLPNLDIHFVLLGQGDEKEVQIINNKIAQVQLSDKIHLLGFKDNPYIYLKNALFLVQSSLFEGFPMVLLEALGCETPVIAFDCFSGPNEIIVHEKNGLLVEDQNFEALQLAIERMVDDTHLYAACKKNSLCSIQKFDMKHIGQQWMKLLENLAVKK